MVGQLILALFFMWVSGAFAGGAFVLTLWKRSLKREQASLEKEAHDARAFGPHIRIYSSREELYEALRKAGYE